ncbi:Uncharacterised protein [BD1-7 clade bacterium]|uniref:Integrase catalytic domain-containing protein n=1 Tax=BD1-7 clade bacterium TaxID=2029982 RepID=A0A5S9P3J1_9GAMM|nr:Uncharacterised protein [BD1-7 clade bacterium]CAA0122986.1 Uncharacterised protein [BD1-7 clade bacterium]
MGIACSLNYVAKLMQKARIKARNGKAFRYGSSSLAMNNVDDNLLKWNFDAERPNPKWTSDITCIWVKNRWLCHSTVMDLSRKIVSWALDTQMTVELVKMSLTIALQRRPIQPGFILHSDRGVQYRATEYQDLIRRHGGQISMSRKGNCWDNAPMESIYGRLKVECVYVQEYRSIEEAKSSIFEYIEMFYNRARKHSALGDVSPDAFEQNS